MGLKVWINYCSNVEVVDVLKNEFEEKGYKAVVIKFDAVFESDFVEVI